MKYILEKQARKTFVIKVQDDGTVVVKAPLYASKRQIRSFVEKNADWIAKAEQRVEKRNALFNKSNAEISRLRKNAKEYITKRVEFFADLMGLEMPAVKITSAKKRFGSCSYKNNLCFSLYLMLYPKEAIDYVVVHELSHIVYKNHSKQFYCLIEKYLPDYKAREKMLKGG